MGTQTAKKADIESMSERRDPIVLRWHDEDRLVLVEPKDQARYFVTVNRAILACQLEKAHGFEQFQKQFDSMLLELKTWADSRVEKIDRVYLAVRDGGLLFVVVKKHPRFDPEFENDLSDLDLRIAHNKAFSMIRLNVLSLPNAPMDAISTFLSPTHTLQLELQNA